MHPDMPGERNSFDVFPKRLTVKFFCINRCIKRMVQQEQHPQPERDEDCNWLPGEARRERNIERVESRASN